MKYTSLFLSLMLFFSVACSFGGLLAEDSKLPEPQDPMEQGELPPLYLGFSVHLEGWKLGNDKVGFDQAVYEKYSQIILGYSDLANSYGMPFTWETASLISPSAEFDSNILWQLYQRGDGIGIHADLGGNPNAPGGQAKLTRDMEKLRLEMESMGIPVTHVSGICSTMDWVTAALDAGYEAATGTVEYCLKSLPLEEQSAEIRACESPSKCHDAYPGEIPDLLRPWRAADGRNWTTPADEGLLLLHAAGSLPCTMEGGTAHCDMQIIEDALAAREPDEFHSLFFIWSLGSQLDEEILKTFYERVQPYIESGDIIWQTIPQVVDKYKAIE